MNLTTEILARYIGGQLEVQNGMEGYLYRGEIKTAEVTDEGEVSITLNWMAQAEGIEAGRQPIPTGWISDTKLDYAASLDLFTVNDLGPGSDGGGNRICLNSSIIGETTVLYPPDGSKLDPAKVSGLDLRPASRESK